MTMHLNWMVLWSYIYCWETLSENGEKTKTAMTIRLKVLECDEVNAQMVSHWAMSQQ